MQEIHLCYNTGISQRVQDLFEVEMTMARQVQRPRMNCWELLPKRKLGRVWVLTDALSWAVQFSSGCASGSATALLRKVKESGLSPSLSLSFCLSLFLCLHLYLFNTHSLHIQTSFSQWWGPEISHRYISPQLSRTTNDPLDCKCLGTRLPYLLYS